MRVQSSNPLKNGGWLHRLGHVSIRPYIPIRKSTPVQTVIVDFGSKWEKWFKSTNSDQIKSLSNGLGIDPMALWILGSAYSTSEQSWAFPMRNSRGSVIGIRLRNMTGQKWSVKGSKQGLFIPKMDIPKQIMIVEGPTDTAAALTMGFYAIGRPSCLGCEDMINDFIKINKVKEVILVSDNDTPGIRGAKKLQETLRVPSLFWIPPAKDLREFVKLGGTKELAESIMKDLIWKKN